MIVLEGPDGGGKTTLAEMLREQLEWPINEKLVAHDMGAHTNLRTAVNKLNSQGFQRKLFDRHPLISEPIYGPVFRSELRDDMGDYAWFQEAWNKFMKLCPMVIFCLPPLEVVKKNLFGDGDNATVWKGIDQIYWQYSTLCARMPWPGIHWDYTNHTYTMAQLVGLIQRHAERRLV